MGQRTVVVELKLLFIIALRTAVNLWDAAILKCRSFGEAIDQPQKIVRVDCYGGVVNWERGIC